MERTVPCKICQHCHKQFIPDWRNRHRQSYCRKAACRNARNIKSHKAWLAKNPDQFKGSENVQHVQNWRKEHPGYWRHKSRKRKMRRADGQIAAVRSVEPLQESIIPNPLITELVTKICASTLQESINSNPLIIGMVAKICRCTLQESIAEAVGSLIKTGLAIQAKAP